MFVTQITETEVETRFSKHKTTHINERFLKGPIPMREIGAAARLPGQALSVLLALHHQTALTKKQWVTLPKGLLTQLGVSRDAKARALKELHQAGLVELEKQKGRSSRVGLSVKKASSSVKPVTNHQWSVVDGGIRCLEHDYDIAKSQLAELRETSAPGIAMWPQQMAEKSWVNIEAFLVAYENALIFHNPPGAENIDIAASFQRARKLAADRDRKKE